MSWDNFNELGDLKARVEAYHKFTGCYLESVRAVSEALKHDRIYRTRENWAWCEEKEIRVSRLPLGRPPANVSQSKKKQGAYDERIRNAIEGKFACVNEDLVSIEWCQNLIIHLVQLLQLVFW